MAGEPFVAGVVFQNRRLQAQFVVGQESLKLTQGNWRLHEVGGSCDASKARALSAWSSGTWIWTPPMSYPLPKVKAAFWLLMLTRKPLASNRDRTNSASDGF